MLRITDKSELSPKQCESDDSHAMFGFVGAVMSIVCANAITEEYAVIGVDLANENTFWKIKSK
jgi:hypothetical protein